MKTAQAEAAQAAEAEEEAWLEANGARRDREEAVYEVMQMLTMGQREVRRSTRWIAKSP